MFPHPNIGLILIGGNLIEMREHRAEGTKGLPRVNESRKLFARVHWRAFRLIGITPFASPDVSDAEFSGERRGG